MSDDLTIGNTLSPIIVPTGAEFTVSASRVCDQNGVPELRVTVDLGSVQTWPDWLAIAFARLQEASVARQRMIAAMVSDVGEAAGNALIEEYRACLQATSAAVFALDAFYGVIREFTIVPEAEQDARRQRNDGRAVWVADAILRASSRMPNDVRKMTAEKIHIAYKVRDLAVHPTHEQEAFAAHPQLKGAQVPKRYADYTFEASLEITRGVVEAMTWVVDHPQSRNHALAAWAKIASAMLHRIIDPIVIASV